jgi:hypothetical protein
MENKTPKRILIVGGGFAGLTVAMELERKLGNDPSWTVLIAGNMSINEEFFGRGVSQTGPGLPGNAMFRNRPGVRRLSRRFAQCER